MDQYVGITSLSLLQIGTVWQHGMCESQVRLEERRFTVNFAQAGWKMTSLAEHFQSTQQTLIPEATYPLNRLRTDGSRLLVFELGDGKRLLVQSLEFFSRCYGASGHVRRVLSTYEWNEALSRLHLPLSPSTDVPADTWAVKLANETRNDDAVFVAHLVHDPFTQAAARRIYNDLEVQYTKDTIAHPSIGPWFSGKARLVVQGLPLDSNDFLGLRIVGGSEPDGPPIYIVRENPGKADKQAGDDADMSTWSGVSGRGSVTLVPTPLTDDTAPDRESDSVDIEAPAFEVVGHRRSVTSHRLGQASTRPRVPVPGDHADMYAPGERRGLKRGVGLASVETPIQLESRGALRDLWNGLNQLKTRFPDIISAVMWYTPSDGHVDSGATPGDPHLNQVAPHPESSSKSISPSARNWVFLDSGRTRGILVARVDCQEKSVYFFEVERRPVRSPTKKRKSNESEEHYHGLVVMLHTDDDHRAMISKFLESIRSCCGMMKEVVRQSEGVMAREYRRCHSRHETVVGEATAINALSKVGINLNRDVGKRHAIADGS